MTILAYLIVAYLAQDITWIVNDWNIGERMVGLLPLIFGSIVDYSWLTDRKTYG